VAATPFSINAAADFAGDAAATVVAADQKGLMLRDGSVAAAGSPNAWKLVNTIDCGIF
jgi:hypothetical protein